MTTARFMPCWVALFLPVLVLSWHELSQTEGLAGAWLSTAHACKEEACSSKQTSRLRPAPARGLTMLPILGRRTKVSP